MQLNDEEVKALRGYLRAGGFLFIDDFWGSWAWKNLTEQMHRVFPDRKIKDIPLGHSQFHTFYDIDEIRQIPNKDKELLQLTGASPFDSPLAVATCGAIN